MEDLTARDIMQPDVITIGPEATVRDLADLLAEHRISGVPVVDDARRVVGMVTEADVIQQDANLHFPHYLQFLDSVIFVESMARFQERFRRAFGAKVKDLMSAEVIAVPPDTSLRDVVTIMADDNVNRVPVVENDVLVGIITRADVVRAIADSRF